jgi:hypothetical protein
VLVIATFENSIYVELVISALKQKDIDNIFAAPLTKRNQPRQLFDTIHRSDGYNMFDAAAILGTCFMLLGAVYGYVLEWGPIIWGIIGAVSGLLIGFVIKYFVIKNKNTSTKKISSEVVIMIRCEDYQWETIEKMLWENTALGIARVKE